MTDAERLAERLAHLPQQLDTWLAAVPPAREAAAAEAAVTLVHNFPAALARVEKMFAELKAEGAHLTEEIVHPLADLASRLTASSEALSAEAHRVTELLDTLHHEAPAVEQLDAGLKTMTVRLTQALSGAAGKVEIAKQSLLEGSTHARATLDAAWHNLGQAFQALQTALQQAGADVTHQIEATLPTASAAAEELVRHTMDAVAATLIAEVEQNIGRALAHVMAELERQVGEAVGALAGAIAGIGDNVGGWHGEHDGNQFVREIEEITQIGEQVAADAMMVPIKVAEILLKRCTGGLF